MLLRLKSDSMRLLLAVICVVFSGFLQADEPVQINRGDLSLHGTLLTAEQSRHLLILHPGSGPTDRHGNQPGMPNNALGLLATALNEAGFAVLSYDKRGVGESVSTQPEADLRPSHYIDDLVAWIDWARANHPKQGVVVIGHSEGALFAKAAGLQRPDEVSAVVALAGAGRPIGELLVEQTQGRLPGPLEGEFHRILDELLAGRTVDEVSAPLASLFRPSVQPYLIEWLAMNPAEIAEILTAPLLVVSGSTDLQVSRADFDMLSRFAQRQAWLDGMNHVLKVSEGPIEAQLSSYLSPEGPLHPDLVPAVMAFLQSLGESARD